MGGRLLREMFGLTEMSVEIPDDQLPSIRKAIHASVKSGVLPDTALALFFPSGKKPPADEPDEAEPEEKPKAKKGAKAKEPEKAPAPAAKPSGQDPSQKAWDALGKGLPEPAQAAQKPAVGPTKNPKAAPAFDPMGTGGDDYPSFGAPKSASQDVGPGGDYRSPFAWDKIDPHGAGDVYQGSQPPSLRGPGVVSRAKGALGRIFSRDPQKRLDRTMRKMDRDARPQGSLSRLFRGKDVTR